MRRREYQVESRGRRMLLRRRTGLVWRPVRIGYGLVLAAGAVVGLWQMFGSDLAVAVQRYSGPVMVTGLLVLATVGMCRSGR